MTLNKVAKLAGVSESTASKALAGSREISKETIDKVIEAAKQTGYYDKLYKRKRLPFHSPVIGVICQEVQGLTSSSILTALSNRIMESGGVMSVSICSYNTENEDKYIKYYSDYVGASGILLFGCRTKYKKKDFGINCPMVVLGNFDENEIEFDSVEMSFELAMQKAAQHTVNQLFITVRIHFLSEHGIAVCVKIGLVNPEASDIIRAQ